MWRAVNERYREALVKRTGDRFELYEGSDGLWYWTLEGGYFPSGPIARSGKGYTTKQAARRSIKSAQSAAKGAPSSPVERPRQQPQ